VAELRLLQRKLDSVSALSEIVEAMRNMAAIYVRRAQAALEASRHYAEVVETALALTLRLAAGRPPALPDDAPDLAVVFAGDQGMCGTFNDRVADAALRHRDAAAGPAEFVTIGRRGYDLLALGGAEPILSLRAPTSLEGVKSQVLDLAAQVFGAYAECGAQQMHFIYNAYESMGQFRQIVRRVLPPRQEELAPPDRSSYGYDPILTAPPAQALSWFVEEYFFIELYRALLESHACENGARLVSMTSASTNIGKRLVELRQQYQSVRQEVITAELLDVVGGAEALGRDD
jgi:F-type H+-transporting ATPase subunit gamma